ncbi:siderophore ABC transporter substrate-binding protein [Aquibium microcysteis]|uniref:siderophore ABC transporter substrate-binding protein n=1 Tax=Aquibium microcysteis TaxID=675281 RepID=UPI00165D204A
MSGGPAASEEIRVRHAQGETVLPARPARVFTFDLAALDTLDALGVAVAGVPGSNVPDYLGRYRGEEYLKIGSLFEPDFEAIAAAEPDLVIVAGRSSPRYAELSRIAPTIDLTVAPDAYLQGAKANAALLGLIFGKEAEAGNLVAGLDAAVASLQEAARPAGGVLVIMTNGGKVTAYGPGSRFGWIHDDIGFAPAATEVVAATHGEAVSFEYLLQINPDWLFVVDRDSAIGSAGASAAATLDNDLVAATKAARNGRIVYVDTVRWYLVGPGIAAVRTVIDEIAAALGKSR